MTAMYHLVNVFQKTGDLSMSLSYSVAHFLSVLLNGIMWVKNILTATQT